MFDNMLGSMLKAALPIEKITPQVEGFVDQAIKYASARYPLDIESGETDYTGFIFKNCEKTYLSIAIIKNVEPIPVISRFIETHILCDLISNVLKNL